MHIQAISIFPEMFASITECGVTARALKAGLWQFNCINPRQFADNKFGHIDDRPFGGGPGMVMMAPPLLAAINEAKNRAPDARVIYLSPQGQTLQHGTVKRLAASGGLILLCGRYEGIDQRVLDTAVDEEISIGDFVVSGGELPAMLLMDAVLRLIDGVLGDSESAQQDSFANGLLDCPHYTRPIEFQNLTVPDVLRGGNHSEIARWRFKASLRQTLAKRPDLLAQRQFTPEESSLLKEIQQEERDNPYINKEKT